MSEMVSGRVLADRYRLIACIGEGGMGAVWEAEHLALQTIVAVKVIAPRAAPTPRARARLLEEAQKAAKIGGPYVVAVFDCGLDGDTPFIAMERLQGESLRQRLQRETKVGPSALGPILADVGRGLARAHAAGVVHRDLSPANVFLTTGPEGPQAKILDFGVAKGVSRPSDAAATRPGAMVGTVHYMSPEQARNPDDAGPQSDLWSLGIIAYECLVGQRPFHGDSLATLCVQILSEPIPVPSEHGSVPDGFDAWFAKATARDVETRFASAHAMTEAFDALIDGASARAVPAATGTDDPTRARWRWPAVAATVVVGSTIAWTTMRGEPAPSSPEPPAAQPAPAQAPPSGAAPLPSDALDETDTTITLTLHGPAGARVVLGDEQLAVLPEPVTLPRGDTALSLEVRADGHRTEQLSVVPTHDTEQTVTLVRIRKPTTKHAKPQPSTAAAVEDLEF